MQQIIGTLLAALATLALASALERWHEHAARRLDKVPRSALKGSRPSASELLLGLVAVAAISALLLPFGMGLPQELLALEVAAMLFGAPELLRALWSFGSSSGRGR